MAVVAFFGVDAFAFEIYVVDQGILAAGAGGSAVVIGLHEGRIPSGSLEDFGQRGAGLGDDEVGLERDAVSEPVAESNHGAAVELAFEGYARGPGRSSAEGDGGRGRSLLTGKGDELRKGLGVRATFARRVPDEVADAEGGKGFAFVPGGEAIAGATGFILPDFASNSGLLGGSEVGLGGSDGNGTGGLRGRGLLVRASTEAGTVDRGASYEAKQEGREGEGRFHHFWSSSMN